MLALYGLVRVLSTEELKSLESCLQLNASNREQLIPKILQTVQPMGGVLQRQLDYDEFLRKVAKHHGINLVEQEEVKMERELFLKLFGKEYQSMSAEEQMNLKEILAKNGLNKSEIASLTSIATLTAAQASGFGIYVLASSTVGTISSVFGVTLPFAFYTGMSKTIAVVIGPLGFLVMGYPLYKEFKDVRSLEDVGSKLKKLWHGIQSLATGNYALATLLLQHIASLRIMKEYQFKEQIRKCNERIGTIEVQIQEVYSALREKDLEIQKIEKEIQKLTLQKNQKEVDRSSLTAQQSFYEKTIQEEQKTIGNVRENLSTLLN